MTEQPDKITQQDLLELKQKPDIALDGEPSNELLALDNALQTLVPASFGVPPEELGALKEEYHGAERREELNEINNNATHAASKVMALSDGYGEPVPKFLVEASLEEVAQVIDPNTENGAWVMERIERLAESLDLDVEGLPSRTSEEPANSPAMQEIIDSIKSAHDKVDEPDQQIGEDPNIAPKGNRGR